MKVAVLSQVPPPIHGSTIMTQTLLRTLEDFGVSPTLIDRRFSKKIEDVGKFRMAKIGSAFYLLFRALGCFVNNRPTHLIVFVSSSPFAFLSDVSIVLLAKIFRIRIVHYVHTMGFSALGERSFVLKGLAEWCFLVADDIVVLSEGMALDMPLGSAKDKVKVIPNTNGFSEAERPESRNADSKFVVLYFSNLIESKGVMDFLDMASQIEPGSKKIEFIVAGAPVDESFFSNVKSRVKHLSTRHDIALLGSVDVGAKQALFRGIDVLVFPSYYPLEAQPMVVIEAMSFGKPVIAYSVGAVPEMIGNSGIVVDLRDATKLANELQSVWSSQEFYESLSIAAVEKFNGTFSSLSYSQSWKELLDASVHRSEHHKKQ